MLLCEVHKFNAKLTQLHKIGVFRKEMQHTEEGRSLEKKPGWVMVVGEDQIERLTVPSDSASLSPPKVLQ